MDLKTYSLDDVLLAALKSEHDSRDIYKELASRTKNAFLKERLEFLSGEEEKHRVFIEGLYRDRIGKEPVLPEKSPVPLPEIRAEDDTPLSEVFTMAMEAEKAVSDFYRSMAEQFFSDSSVSKTLVYLSIMEMGHYSVLEMEREVLLRQEDLELTWDMMHVGP